MKLLLDAQISHRGVAIPLRKHGHDVPAVVELPELDGVQDEDILQLSCSQKRILVTFNISDFAPLLGRFTREEGGHTGCILISSKTFQQDQFGAIVTAIKKTLKQTPEARDWKNRVVWLAK